MEKRTEVGGVAGAKISSCFCPHKNFNSVFIYSHVIPNLYDFLLWNPTGDILKNVSFGDH